LEKASLNNKYIKKELTWLNKHVLFSSFKIRIGSPIDVVLALAHAVYQKRPLLTGRVLSGL
jgi:hypothetical protein